MSDQPSAAFERFMASVTAPMTRENIESYDLGALASIAPDERPLAENVLAERLAAGDGRAAMALVTLASPRARTVLKQALQLPVAPMVRVEVARALAQLGDFNGEVTLVDVLEHGGTLFERELAAHALQLFRTPSAESALLKAVANGGPGVSGNAFGALIFARGLASYDNSYRGRIGLTYPLLGSPLPSVRALALEWVRALLARLDAGESADQLDLAPVDDSTGPAALWMESLRSQAPPWKEDLALDALDQLKGRERRWAEDVLLGYLHLDPRASRAAAHAGMARAAAPLREVMERYGGTVQIEAAAALWQLTNDAAAHRLLQAAEAGAEPELARRARRALGAHH